MLAGFTDCLDGFLARRYHWQSVLGSFLDPLADKLLIATCFISLAVLGIIPWWLAVLVFSRDLIISMGVVWYLFFQLKIEFKPTLLSKINTMLQLGLVMLCLLKLTYFQSPDYLFNALICIITATSIITLIDYVWTGCVNAWPVRRL